MKNIGLDLPNKYDKHNILFSNLPMKWNSDYQSFVSSEDKVGLCSINGVPINRWLTCYVEFKMPSNDDDRMYIYIKSPSDYYYFFGFKQGIMNLVSNNVKFNEALAGLKSKDTVIKMPDGQTFEIQAVEPSTAQNFVARVLAAR